VLALPSLSAGVNVITSLAATTLPANSYLIYHRLTGGYICFDSTASVGNVAYASASHIIGDVLTLVPGSARPAISFIVTPSVHNVETRLTSLEAADAAPKAGSPLDQTLGTISVTEAGTSLTGFVWSVMPTLYDGYFTSLTVYTSAAGGGTIRFYAPNADGSFTNIGVYPVTVASGANTFSAGANSIPTNLFLPAGSRIGYGDNGAGMLRFANGGQTATMTGDTGLGSASVTATPQAVTIRMEAHVSARIRSRSPVRIDQRFSGTTTLPLWSLTGWTWSSGLVAPASGSWTQVTLFTKPTAMDRRRIQARFTVADTTAKFGLCYVPPSTYGTASKTYGSAAVVDGTASKLQLYQLTQGGVATLAAETSFVGTLPATVDIQHSKSGMSQTVTLVNAISGATIATLTHSHQSDVDPRGEFNSGNPGVVFVSGAGGAAPVTCTHFQFNRGRRKKLHAIVLGDSMEQGNALGTSWQISWPYLWDTARGFGDVMNAAQGGSDTGEAVARLAMDLDPFEANYVLIKFTNDTSITAWRTNMQNIINRVVASGAVPILCTLPPSGVSARQTIATAANINIRAFYFGAYDYIDFAKALSVGNDGVTVDSTLFLASESGTGYVHPTVAGNAAMYARLVSDAPYLLNDPEEA
jgi:hypothetical protein